MFLLSDFNKMKFSPRLSNFLYMFNLRQGTILIAVQHIALSACALILLLVGITHTQEMMDTLNADMEDNAEREGIFPPDEEDLTIPHGGSTEATNNQQKFKVAQNLAMMVVFLLYGSLVGTAIYLVFCVALFYGAAKNKREYLIPWALFATIMVVVLVVVTVAGDGSATLIRLCGGHVMYRITSALLIFSHLYCIFAVGSFIYELSVFKNGRIVGSETAKNSNENCRLTKKPVSKLSVQI